MAIRFPTTADYLLLTGYSLPIAVDGSVFLQAGTLNDGLSGSEHQTIFAIFTGGTTDFSDAYVWLGFRESGGDQVLFLQAWNGTDPVQDIEFVWAADGWVPGGIGYTYTASSGQFELFTNGVSRGTMTVDMTGLVATAIVLGSDVTPTANTVANPWVCYPRVAGSVLTGGQFAANAASRTPIATVEIGLTPLEYADELGAFWTAVGAPVTTGGPVDIDNNTADTATEITSLNYAVVQDIAAHAQDDEAQAETGEPGYCAAWWSFTTTAVCTFFFGVTLTSSNAPIAPILSVLTGSPGSLALDQSVELAWNGSEYVGSIVVLVVPSTVYYILAEAQDDLESGGVFELSVERQPNQVIPAGSAAYTLSTTGGAIWFQERDSSEVLSIRQTTGGAEGNNDVKTDGTFMLTDASTAGKIGQVYGSDLTLIADDILTPAGSISTIPFHSPAPLFYLTYVTTVGITFQATVTEIGLDGVPTGNDWLIPAALTAASRMQYLSVNPGATIAYYVPDNAGAAVRTVKRWNLTTDLAMTDLVVLAAGYTITDLLVTSAGDVLIAATFSSTASPNAVFRYNAAGTLQGLLSLGPSASLPLLALDPDSTLAWVGFRTSTTFNRWQITLASMTAAETISWTRDVEEEPTFLAPFHGPFFIARATIAQCGMVPPPSPGTDRAMRRERIFLLPSSESNNAVFAPRIEFLGQPGVGDGDPTSQGYDPKLMFSVSKDGGKTYSPEQWADMGKQGEYDARWIFRRTPNRYRNAVGKVVITDPVDVVLVDAVVPKITEGSS